MTTPHRPPDFVTRFSLFAFVFVVGFACARPGVTSVPEPSLCSIDASVCRPMTAQQEQLPTKAGWVCCWPLGSCIAVDNVADCPTTTVGWCANYTETKNASGTDVATCHDEPAA